MSGQWDTAEGVNYGEPIRFSDSWGCIAARGPGYRVEAAKDGEENKNKSSDEAGSERTCWLPV